MNLRLTWIIPCVLALVAPALAQDITQLANGNVGIGTTTPAYPLDVIGIAEVGNSNNDYSSQNVTSTTYNWLYISGAGTADGNTTVGQGYQDKDIISGLDAGQWGPELGGMVMLRGLYTTLGSTSGGSYSPEYTGANVELYFKRPGGTNGAGGYTTPTRFYDDTTSMTAYEPYKPELGLILNSAGQVGIGTANPTAPLEVNGGITLTLGSAGAITFPDGTSQTTAFNPANCGADYAEAVDVTGDRTAYTPGDILVIDPSAPGKFLKSNQPYSTLVAGIYSTKPGFVGRLEPADSDAANSEIPMAMVGRVPTKVSAENGPIRVGGLLVTSSTMGYAMKGTDRTQMLGAVVGKAMGSLGSGTGVVEVLVTLQ